jgi:hypothetical protein
MRWASKLLNANLASFCSVEAVFSVFYSVFLLKKAFGGVRSEELQRAWPENGALIALIKSSCVFIVHFWAFEAWRERVEPEHLPVLRALYLSAFSRHLVQGAFVPYIPATRATTDAFVSQQKTDHLVARSATCCRLLVFIDHRLRSVYPHFLFLPFVTHG